MSTATAIVAAKEARDALALLRSKPPQQHKYLAPGTSGDLVDPGDVQAMRKTLEWLANESGHLPERSIAFAALGIEQAGLPYPSDPFDLRRCLRYLRLSPEARTPAFALLRSRSSSWAKLIVMWDRLSDSLQSEIGEKLNLFPIGAANNTAHMIAKCLSALSPGI